MASLSGGSGAASERVAEALAPLARWLADNMPRIEGAVQTWTDHGLREAEMHANWGDRPDPPSEEPA